jgi:hypothetical protein
MDFLNKNVGKFYFILHYFSKIWGKRMDEKTGWGSGVG